MKLACERPELLGRSLCLWDCTELARALKETGLVQSISSETVRRILNSQQLKPWRYHYWIHSPKEDPDFLPRLSDVIDLYARTLPPDEIVLCVDEKTSLQPRIRPNATRPAAPGQPVQLDHLYKRAGALNLFAAFDTRSGQVYGQSYDRKRQIEFIQFLEHLNRQISSDIQTIHIVCDNLPTHHGKQVRKWLEDHPRFRFHFTPVHCSWMNQVEQWFSILQRKRFRIADFHSKEQLKLKLDQFIVQWNQIAHPFNWSRNSIGKLVAASSAKEAA